MFLFEKIEMVDKFDKEWALLWSDTYMVLTNP